jgi:hypothetical protein
MVRTCLFHNVCNILYLLLQVKFQYLFAKLAIMKNILFNFLLSFFGVCLIGTKISAQIPSPGADPLAFNSESLSIDGPSNTYPNHKAFTNDSLIVSRLNLLAVKMPEIKNKKIRTCYSYLITEPRAFIEVMAPISQVTTPPDIEGSDESN